MLRNLKQFFDQHIRPAGGLPAAGAQHALQVATAALLIEVMRSDRELKDAERQAVTAAIQARFELSMEETATLLRLADTEAEQATDYYQFTTLINKHFNAAQKEQVVEYMWQVAAADHVIDRFERTLVHKVADLLHVSRPAQIAARERALYSIGPEAES
ncbi:MAG TPA: TerB family tellurite resistance protein [Acidiferrobacterales bacterium]|nr:TerB family tellurite resistance protein [Acidiferrobacterales bacterium]